MQRSLTITPHGKLIDDSWKDRLIQNAISSSKGRSSLAAAMVNPIRRSMDYQSIARKCFLIEPMPQGAALIYDRPIEEIGDGSEEE
jgi:type 1 glutamine amidotransferase